MYIILFILFCDRSPTEVIHQELKFLVFEQCLRELFTNCRNCAAKTKGKILYRNGSLVKMQQCCQVCDHVFEWLSQPLIGDKPAGNLMISAGILFSGLLPAKVLRMYKLNNIAAISNSTFLNHQKFYLFPSIAHVWHNFQQDYIESVKADGPDQRLVTLGGDGRSDTPGHCAKFGSYSVIDLEEGSVVDIQVVQVNINFKHFRLDPFNL